MPTWASHTREDWTPAQLIAFFQNEPLDFEPGTGWKYNNSGYTLLGAIIEKVSGKKYEDFLAETIFQPLGMERTRCGSDGLLIAGRVAGYQRTPGGVVNAPYLSMTLPYSAGALVSTVDDLANWQAALDRDGLLSAESLRRMWTPVTLPDGRATRYGWAIWSYEGHAVVEHGGAINGFVSANMRWPDDRIYVAVLSNATGPGRDPRMLAQRAASLAAGVPADDRKAVTRAPETLERYAGVYKDSDGDDWTVRRNGDRLEVGAGPSHSEVFASPACHDCFFYRDHVRDIRFERSPSGEVLALWIDEHIGPVERAVPLTGSVMSCGIIGAGPRVSGTGRPRDGGRGPDSPPVQPFRSCAHQRRVDEDAQQRSRQRGVVHGVFDQLRVPSHLNQDVRELADLGQAHPDEQGSPKRVAKEQNDGRPDHHFPDDDEGDDHAQEKGIREERPGVDQCADRHEEERHERVAHR